MASSARDVFGHRMRAFTSAQYRSITRRDATGPSSVRHGTDAVGKGADHRPELVRWPWASASVIIGIVGVMAGTAVGLVTGSGDVSGDHGRPMKSSTASSTAVDGSPPPQL